jgi:hypothetical protein
VPNDVTGFDKVFDDEQVIDELLNKLIRFPDILPDVNNKDPEFETPVKILLNIQDNPPQVKLAPLPIVIKEVNVCDPPEIVKADVPTKLIVFA